MYMSHKDRRYSATTRAMSDVVLRTEVLLDVLISSDRVAACKYTSKGARLRGKTYIHAVHLSSGAHIGDDEFAAMPLLHSCLSIGAMPRDLYNIPCL